MPKERLIGERHVWYYHQVIPTAGSSIEENYLQLTLLQAGQHRRHGTRHGHVHIHFRLHEHLSECAPSTTFTFMTTQQ